MNDNGKPGPVNEGPTDILPHQFSQPGSVPVAISIEAFGDMVAVRTETMHGSHIVFLLGDIAVNAGEQLIATGNKAQAQALANVDTDDILRITRH
jgi:hypothetical protein